MKKKSESILGMAFFGPALVLLTVFLFLPMILTLVFSFTDFFALNPSLTHFVGLDNFFQIFKDEDFRQAFVNTVCFVIIIVPLQGLGSLGLALLINKVTHCKRYFKVAFFLPVVMSLAVVSTLGTDLRTGGHFKFHFDKFGYSGAAVYQQLVTGAPVDCHYERMAGRWIPDDHFFGRTAGNQPGSV